MEETQDALLLPDDVLREILLRVPADDPATLFRCAATCKRWRAIVADPSSLRHRWPENACHPSSLLGFFNRPRDIQEPPFFFPTSPKLVFGPRRHSLASFVSGAHGDILNDAVPLSARGGLLLVRLATGRLAGDSLCLAVCDILAGTCDVLPQLECRFSQYGCAVLAREDCCSLHVQQQRRSPPSTGYSTFFKVLAMVIGSNDQDCNLYTFSSSEPNWSEPRKCFDEAWQRDTFGFRILLGTMNTVTVCRGVAYWLGSYSTNQLSSPRYFTLGVNVKTGQMSITDLLTPTNHLAVSTYFALKLSVADDGRPSLLHLQKEGLRLNTWIQENDGTWLLTRAVELKPPKQVWDPVYIAILSGEKSGVLFMADVYGRVYKTDLETRVMEDVTIKMFQNNLSMTAVPIEIDWLALFMSRLAV